MSYNYDFTYGRRNRIIGPAKLTSDADIFTPTSDQKYTLGLELDMNDATGRRFVYCKNGATALGKSKFVQTPAHDAQSIASTIQTGYGVSASETKFDILVATGSGITANSLRDGWMIVSDGGTAMGDMYLIKSNKWTTSDTVLNVTIADQGGLRNAIAATDDVSFIPTKYKDVIVTTEAPAGGPVGVPLVDVTANYYFWAQCAGYAPVFTDDTDTIVVGDPVMLSVDNTAASDGCVALVDASADDYVVGNCVFAGAVSECSIIDIRLP
jgi:hypothetical protein